MARIAGVDLPKDKRVEIGLTYIYGIGRSRSNFILSRLEIDKNKKVKDLTDQEIGKIKDFISDNFRVEGDLRTEVNLNIKRLIEINCYRGIRHKMGLPVRGQRTRTNSRTRKGARKTVPNKKK